MPKIEKPYITYLDHLLADPDFDEKRHMFFVDYCLELDAYIRHYDTCDHMQDTGINGEYYDETFSS